MIYLILSLIGAGVAYAATRRIAAPVIVFFFTLLTTYLGLPTIRYGFEGLPLLITFTGIIVLVFELLRFAVAIERGTKNTFRWPGPAIVVGLGLGVGLIILPLITTWSAFYRASSYRELIGEVTESKFSKDTTPVDVAQVRIVDQKLARILGEKRLGEDAGLGSRVDLGTLNIQQVKGELWWVGPLNHSGFWKWGNSSGTPGYVMVSATNERDVRLVREINGEPLTLQYNKGSYWWDNPARHLYQNGYATIGLTDFTFEIDDAGNPYWVVTAYKRTVGYAGSDAVGAVVLDAQTGEIKSYPVENAPTWIDRIQPQDLVTTQLNDWGVFIHGWWNSNFAKEGIIKVTPGMSLVYGGDGESYWYTGMSSAGSDEATIGFMLVNTRTKEAKLYRQPGATETAAVGSAQGQVQEKGYYATSPILYNVSGVPTYFTTLKDNAGLVKLMAWVSVENYSVVGTGKTVATALRAYRRALLNQGNATVADGTVKRQGITGLVLLIAPVTNGGQTTYYLMIEGYGNKMFVAPDLSPEVIATKVGHRVTVTFDDGGNELVDIVTFDNLGIEFQKTEAQIAREIQFSEAQESQQ